MEKNFTKDKFELISQEEYELLKNDFNGFMKDEELKNKLELKQVLKDNYNMKMYFKGFLIFILGIGLAGLFDLVRNFKNQLNTNLVEVMITISGIIFLVDVVFLVGLVWTIRNTLNERYKVSASFEVYLLHFNRHYLFHLDIIRKASSYEDYQNLLLKTSSAKKETTWKGIKKFFK